LFIKRLASVFLESSYELLITLTTKPRIYIDMKLTTCFVLPVYVLTLSVIGIQRCQMPNANIWALISSL